MPPEPRLDFPFLIMTLCAIAFNILTVIYFRKARNYKKQLDKCKRQPRNKNSISFIKPTNSPTEITTTSNQSKGEST